MIGFPGPLDESNHMFLVGAACLKGVNPASRNRPGRSPLFADGLLRFPATLANRHLFIETIQRLSDNALAVCCSHTLYIKNEYCTTRPAVEFKLVRYALLGWCQRDAYGTSFLSFQIISAGDLLFRTPHS
jgi:hypothetical protein